ncbi:MAG: hypothetical protein ACFFC7_04915 [Candidatus Hermodarchaeota archaeon]
MSLKEKALYIASLFSFMSALFAYLYESRYTGMLPVISYPLRVYTLPLILIGFVLLVLGLVVRIYSMKKNKSTDSDATLS